LKADDARFKTVAEKHGMTDPADAYFFTNDRRTAQSYARADRAWDYQNAEPGVIPTYLSLKNPLVIDNAGKKYDGPMRQEELIVNAKDDGYDGVILRNTIDTYNVDGKRPADIYIAFDPTQIKSVNNRGTFDPNDPRILFQPASPENAGDGRLDGGAGRARAGADMPATGDKGFSDVSREAADKLGDLLVSDTGVVKTFGDLDVVGRTAVLAVMRDLAQDLKVAEVVVPLVPVDVVNVLGAKELTSKVLLDNPAMLIDLLPLKADDLVPSHVAAMNELSGAMARAATETPGLSLSRSVGDGDAARGADVSLHQNIVPEPKGSGKARGAIEFGDDGRSIISLFETADASTALHETGHHFLHLLKSMAAREDAPLAMRADWDVVKNWWSANADAVAADSPSAVTGDDVRAVLTVGTTGDRVKDLAVNVGLQEQWARGFEAYLREGTAPTSRLAGVFEQFKQWLTQVYRSLKDLNVNLSDDVRGVFDRLLGAPENMPEIVPENNIGRQPALDFSSPPPEPPVDGLAEAAARVGHQDSPKAMREMFGLKDDGSFDEQADIDQYREMGILDEEDEAMLKLADDAVKAADAYSETLRIAATCAAGMI
jgi:hypothetical protein